MGGAYSTHRKDEKFMRSLFGKPEDNRLLGSPRRRYIKMDLKKMRCESVDWIHLAHDRDQWWALLNTILNLKVSMKHLDLLSY
jgi:hypothetical protein